MDDQRLKVLLMRFKQHQISDAEMDELNEWFHSVDHGTGDLRTRLGEDGGEGSVADELFAGFSDKLHRSERTFVMRPVYRAAAVILVLLTAALWYHTKMQKADVMAVGQVKPTSIGKPGRNTAMLTLANGQKVSLDEVNTNKLITQNGVSIEKTANGQLRYIVSSESDKAAPIDAFNTIETPRAGQYEVVLPDGSKVWLNAATSLRYPVRFTGNERRVELNGEAYFEVGAQQSLTLQGGNRYANSYGVRYAFQYQRLC